METFVEYSNWLERLKKDANQSTQSSINELIVILGVLNDRKIFIESNPRIAERLQALEKKIKDNPLKSKIYLDSCCASIKTISAKFYGVVPKGHYQMVGVTYGIFLGVLVGSLIYFLSREVAYIGLGLSIGPSLGLGVGALQDKRAKIENRVLIVD